MIKVYTGFKGFAISLFVIAGVILFLSILSWGITKAALLLLPLVIVLSYLLIIIFSLGVLPATFFKDLRPSLSMYSVLMSYGLGAATWVMSFLFVIKIFGLVGVFFAFLFQFLVPVAIVGAMLKGAWVIAGHLIVWTSFTYGMKFYSQWLSNLNSRNQEKRDIIDVDVIEVRDH